MSVEPYVDRKELARRMGVSVATIDRRVRLGMPSVLWSARARRFLPSEALAWVRANGPEHQQADVVVLDERRTRVQ